MRNLILVLTILFTGVLSAQSVTVSGTTFLVEGSHPSIDLTISSSTFSIKTYRVLAANFLNPLDSYWPENMVSGSVTGDDFDVPNLDGDHIVAYASLGLTQEEIARIIDRASGTVVFYRGTGSNRRVVHSAEILDVTSTHVELSDEGGTYISGPNDTWEIILD